MARTRSHREQTLIQDLDRIITASGGDASTPVGMRVREIMHTALKLIRDEADEGELKLISRSLKELRYALKVFRPYTDTPKISIFGSARTAEDHPHYQTAVAFSRRMAEEQWMVITGAGDGIMRAGHGGAGRDQSFGVSIRLPFETNANEYIEGDHKLIVFRYFFTRKLMFMWQSHAIGLFPGGFGTQDECFEALTLVQTGKAALVPIVMVESPGGDDYWKHWEQYVRNELLREGMIDEVDERLYFITDDVEAAVQHVLDFYRNYHSQRFVFDTLVVRMRRALTDGQVNQLNEEFVDLVANGVITQGGPLEHETEHLDLPRLRFTHTKRDYGRLRMMIDRINEFDSANAG